MMPTLHLPRALAAMLLATLAACGAEEHAPLSEISVPRPIPDLSGHWEHILAHFLPPESGPGPVANMPGLEFAAMNVWVGDYRNPILQPWAAEAVKAHDVAELESGDVLKEQLQLCMALGVPNIILLREPVEFLQEAEMVMILYHHDSQVRRVYLNAAHPETPAPLPYGHSVGHYEGDTLLIDTIQFSNTGPIDYYGTPHTPALHVVERYRVTEDGVLEAAFRVSDAGAFTTEWGARQIYQRSAESTPFRENICADNVRDETAEYPVPTDVTPDF
jgi:hypothetical protein